MAFIAKSRDTIATGANISLETRGLEELYCPDLATRLRCL